MPGPTLLFLYGPPAVGKLTVARAVAVTLDTVEVTADQAAERILQLLRARDD